MMSDHSDATKALYLNSIFINISFSYNLLDVDNTEISNTMKSAQFGVETFTLVTCHNLANWTLMTCMFILSVSYSGAMANTLASGSKCW